MYLKKPSPSQLQAIGSNSLPRKEGSSTASVQTAAKVPGKAVLVFSFFHLSANGDSSYTRIPLSRNFYVRTSFAMDGSIDNHAK